MWVELNTGSGWKMKLARRGNGQMAKNLTTGSTLRGLRTVQFWTVQRSAAQNVTRIYTGYVANPPNKEESYLLIDILTWNSRKYDNCGQMLLSGQKFPIKTLWEKNVCIIWETFFHTRLEKREKNSRHVCIMEYSCHDLKVSQVTDKSCPRMR